MLLIRYTFERQQPVIRGKQDCRSSYTITDTSKGCPSKEHESDALLLPVDDCLRNMKPEDESDAIEKK
jgi:hypothetical protein